MNAGVIICSRLSSSRIPRKALYEVNGVPLLGHLIQRLVPTGLPIVIAVPTKEVMIYHSEFGIFAPQVTFFAGWEEDPLRRMKEASLAMGFDVVVRVNHDKVFVQPEDIRRFLHVMKHSNLDYLYSSSFVPGSGFEVIRASSLYEASHRFKNVEHVSYAIHAVTDRKTDVDTGYAACPHRLLVDYPEDIDVLSQVLAACGNECSLQQALTWLDRHPAVSALNRMPLATIYTCAYNARAYIAEAMQSVMNQIGFSDCEYLCIDDGSTDGTQELMERTAFGCRNVKIFANAVNLGLASSSNLSLRRARGKYIIRLDADDYFSKNDSLQKLFYAIEGSGADVIYPDHYLGSDLRIEKGNVHHHAGGAIFSTRALNHMKFTDGLRGYDSYDLYERAKTQLKIGYLNTPTFFYRQHDNSLSKQDPAARAAIKEEIDARLTQGD